MIFAKLPDNYYQEYNNRTLFYVQYFCKQLDDDITLKRREALVVVSIGVFICLLFLCALYYLYETSKIEYKTWDVNTVTAADFTVECNIPQEMWNKFVEQYKDTIEPNETMINKFHDEFKLEVERVVQSENSVLQDKQYENIKISTIQYKYNLNIYVYIYFNSYYMINFIIKHQDCFCL